MKHSRISGTIPVQASIAGNVAVSAAGRQGVYFSMPAGQITDGNQSLNSTFFSVSGASAGTYKLVSAQASGVLRISRLVIHTASAVNLTFRQTSVAASSIDFMGPLPMGDKQVIILDRSDSPWFVTTGTKDFGINVSAGVGVNGTIYWY